MSIIGNIGKAHETIEFKKFLTQGKVAYNLIAISPNIAALKAMKDSGLNIYVPTEEPIYFGLESPKFGETDKTTPYFDAVMYLRNVDVPDNIVQVRHRIFNLNEVSDAGKYKVINMYGSTTYITEQEYNAGIIPALMDFYVNEGVKRSLKGEEHFIGFCRALYNQQAVNNPTAKNPKVLDIDKRPLHKFYLTDANYEKLFKGDFSEIREALLSVPDAKVGYLTGVKTTAEGKEYQDFFIDVPLRSFQVNGTKDDYMVTKLQDAMAHGRYASTQFGLPDTKGREYDPSSKPQASAMDSGLPGLAGGGLPGLPGLAPNGFPPAPDFTNEEPDDLPF